VIAAVVTGEDYLRSQLALPLKRSPALLKILALIPDLRELRVGQPFEIIRHQKAPLIGVCTNPTLPILDIALLLAKHEGVLAASLYLYSWQRRCEGEHFSGHRNKLTHQHSSPLLTRFLVECSHRGLLLPAELMLPIYCRREAQA